MSSFAELFPQTLALDLTTKKEAVKSAHDEWRMLLPQQVINLYPILEGQTQEITTIIKTLELMPDFLVTKGLSKGQIGRRNTVITQKLIQDALEEDYPFIDPNPYNPNATLFPFVTYTYFDEQEEPSKSTGKMFILRNPRVLNGDAFWSYTNKILSRVNESLAQDLQPPILLHPKNQTYDDYADSLVWTEPFDDTSTNPL